MSPTKLYCREFVLAENATPFFLIKIEAFYSKSFHFENDNELKNSSETPINEIVDDRQNKVNQFNDYFSIWDNWMLIFIPLVALYYIYYRFRIKYLRDIQNVKDNISADLHDEIGARLTNIHFLLSFAKRKVIRNNEVTVYLEKMEIEIQKSSEALDEIVWNLKIPDKNLEGLIARMRRYSSNIFEQENIAYRFNIKNRFKEREMCLQKRRELFLIFKELINNFRKHANATSCIIKIAERDEMFFMKFSDNGVGFNPEKATDRNGLKNIKFRLKKWGGKIEIRSSPGMGCFFKIWLPYKTTGDRLFNKNLY